MYTYIRHSNQDWETWSIHKGLQYIVIDTRFGLNLEQVSMVGIRTSWLNISIYIMHHQAFNNIPTTPDHRHTGHSEYFLSFLSQCIPPRPSFNTFWHRERSFHLFLPLQIFLMSNQRCLLKWGTVGKVPRNLSPNAREGNCENSQIEFTDSAKINVIRHTDRMKYHWWISSIVSKGSK